MAKVVKLLALPSVIQCVNVCLLSGHWNELRVMVFFGFVGSVGMSELTMLGEIWCIIW